MKAHQQDSGKRWVVVTGCSSGIGLRIASGLQQRGYPVIATCRRLADCKTLQHQGIRTIELDLADADSVDAAVTCIKRDVGDSLYALVNNGAYGQPGAVIDVDREVLKQQFEVNVFGTQQLTNGLLPLLLDNNAGRIIQISSILGFICLRFRGAYNASKYALEALTDTMRLEHDGSDVYFSLIEPGPITSRFRPNAHAMFRRHIDSQNSMFRNTYSRVEKRLGAMGKARFTLPPEAVLKAVVHALESRRPKIRYRVTVPTRVMAVLKRLLTDRAMDRFLIANSDS